MSFRNLKGILLIVLYLWILYHCSSRSVDDADLKWSLGTTRQFKKLELSDCEYVWRKSRPVIYSDIREHLKPREELDRSYKQYFERVGPILMTLGNQVAACYRSGFKHCISYNATEGVYASKPYDERDLILSPPSSPLSILVNSDVSKVLKADKKTVVIGMVTAPTQYVDRMAIRRTWCNTTILGLDSIQCMFFTGFSPKDDSFQKAFLRDEASLFNDLIQFDIIDTYLNLTALQLQAYNWTLHHFPALDYYIRVDTDMHVNIPLLLRKLLFSKQTKFIYGRTFVNARPYRNPLHKNYLPAWIYPEERFPPYQSGCLCIWSRDVLERVVIGSSFVRPIHYVDDVYYGQIFKHYNLSLTQDRGLIQYAQIPFSSYLGYHVVAAHRYSPVDLIAISLLFPPPPSS